MFPRLVSLACAACLVHGTVARAEGFLTGNVSYDAATRLYTYAYSLRQDGPYAANTVWLFTPTGDLNPANPAYVPNSHTEPAGWSFAWQVGDPVLGIPHNALGWDWSTPNGQGVAPGTTLAGFQFTTSMPPGVVRYQLNQGVASDHGGYGGIPDGTGTVVGPSVASTPEPSTLALVGVGALMLLGARRRPTSTTRTA